MKKKIIALMLSMFCLAPAFCQIPEYTVDENGIISFVKIIHTNDEASQKELFERVISYTKKNPGSWSLTPDYDNYSFSSDITDFINEDNLKFGIAFSWICYYYGSMSIQCRDGRARISVLFSRMKPSLILPLSIQPYAKHNVDCKIVERYPFTKQGDEGPKGLEEKVYGASWECVLSDISSIFDFYEKALLDNTGNLVEEDW